ncbi:hypothetical protein SXCC_02565 [Gluconacetobacter sp. SXCC-1]|uniref:Uncharacterized protein n=3 Tax=Komagataeibacter rhaeticus TaxID=215221 RepID=A0A181CAN0_9PROT|nr:hypothetical protein [Komagataeibacter rhaeticus]ATU72901.1 hypothetical protein CT154_08655 [Komagataeibacter xylinus]EGG76640.1 hypothetical protein SXCC_02565 [Gluconacetobacter sp. SXCC-1]QIP35352.1 hypothetical protein GWK63_07635 [Komagataeibacter rhaeticus]QOC47920.1 hypothetical protein ICJ78_07695 [Komagataeibacter rhaeticus]WPP22699.1 hypothetical protein SCD25_04190 [Komagataeibacter rhaeticus]
MTDTNAQVYAVYLTAAATEAGVARPAGYVTNRVVWDGTSAWTPGSGSAIVADPDGQFPIGGTYTPSTGYALAGASSATAGTALPLTLTPDHDGPATKTTVTLSDGGAGGTFSASTVTFGAGVNTAQGVTYTPKAAGTVTISATNTGGLTNPASLSVTVGAAAT